MKINSVNLVTFSPTGNSKKVAEAIVNGIQAPIEYVDLTPPSARTQQFKEFNDELVVIAVPVYAGRVPSEAAYRIRRLKGKKSLSCVPKLNGDKTPAVLVVTYGNRAYEDALRELGDRPTRLHTESGKT